MATKERLKQVRVYEKEEGKLRRLALRKTLTSKKRVLVADIIRQLIKEA